MTMQSQMTFGKRIANGAPETQLARLEAWLVSKLSEAARPKVGEIGLCHYALMPDGNEEHHIIDRVKIGKDASPQQIAEQMYANARSNVEAHTRPQRYGLVAVAAADASEVVGNMNFLLAPPPRNGWGEGETEPATNGGVLAQQMRHYEACMRLMIMSQQHCTGVLETEVERLRADNEKLRATHFAMIQAREELLDRSAERNMRIRQEQAELARGERWAQRAEQLLTGLVENHLGLPQGVTAPPSQGTSGAMKRWLSTLNDEQRSKLTESLDAILTPEQGTAFLEAVQATVKEGGP